MEVATKAEALETEGGPSRPEGGLCKMGGIDAKQKGAKVTGGACRGAEKQRACSFAECKTVSLQIDRRLVGPGDKPMDVLLPS